LFFLKPKKSIPMITPSERKVTSGERNLAPYFAWECLKSLWWVVVEVGVVESKLSDQLWL
jgi:hypothetical protein